jgi:hypothetical protein
MKKVLVLLSIAGVAQGLLAERTQYKYLHKLDGNSEIRRKCESAKPALFGRSATEKACDSLDNQFETLQKQFRLALWTGRDMNGYIQQAKKENADTLKTLGVINNNDEQGYMAVLVGQIINEEIKNYDACRKAAEDAFKSGAAFR